MCTAVSYTASKHYFGRTLDLECSFGEHTVITPRRFPFSFRFLPSLSLHHAIIGIGIVAENYPLYYDAVNEEGLAMAGLNFPISTIYKAPKKDTKNIAPFELIPWVLSQCSSVNEAKTLLCDSALVNVPFNESWSLSPLHWIIADRNEAITIEAVEDGVKVYQNPVGVLTNEPPFYYQLTNLSNYMNVTSAPATNRFSNTVPLTAYSRGMGALGLPGDFSSASRFVRASFVKTNCVFDHTVNDVNQFFHILNTVEQPYGCVKLIDDSLEKTVYASCCDTEKGIYYHTTYGCRQIHAVDLRRENLEADMLTAYPLVTQENVSFQN